MLPLFESNSSCWSEQCPVQQNFDASVLQPISTASISHAKNSVAAAFGQRFLDLRKQVGVGCRTFVHVLQMKLAVHVTSGALLGLQINKWPPAGARK